MLTRNDIRFTYNARPATRMSAPGVIRVETRKGVTQTWAISRPLSGYAPSGAPMYLTGSDTRNSLIRTGIMPLSPARPRVEMDPSNPRTWQRSYRFTQ